MDSPRTISGQILRLLFAVLAVATSAAHAQEAMPAADFLHCLAVEPDSLQISWSAPCDDGSWLFEPGVGCRMWDWHPDPLDEQTWSGECRSGAMTGRDIAQWFEHGHPIDRFEGTFVAGERRGVGRYVWDKDDWYVGMYEEDLPNGVGTAQIAGRTFSGLWQHGCLAGGADVVAIGVPRRACEVQVTH